VRRGAAPLLAAALALAALACHEAKEEMETTDAVPVAVRAARRGTIDASVWATGIVKPEPGAELIVTAPQPARILEIPKAEGEIVHRGDLLVRFEIPSLHADEAARESDRARARARLENAGSAAQRAEGLFSRGIAARKEVEDARRELSDAQAAVSEAEGAVRATGLLLQRESVAARFDGVIAARFHNPGDLVEPGSADPILRVIDANRLQVEASVPLNVLSQVAVSNPATIRGPEADRAEEGTVTSRAAAVETPTATALVRIAFSKPTRMTAGTPVQVEIRTEEHAGALLVPVGSVVRELNESFLYVVDGEGRARRRLVEIGIATSTEAEILKGIGEGDRVIVQGQEALPDGAAVTVEGS
jgi:RND family efflux transporter MFP subunit